MNVAVPMNNQIDEGTYSTTNGYKLEVTPRLHLLLLPMATRTVRVVDSELSRGSGRLAAKSGHQNLKIPSHRILRHMYEVLTLVLLQ